MGPAAGVSRSAVVATLGLAMMAVRDGVELYADAEVPHTVDQNSLLYSIRVFVAERSSLRSRGLIIASSPNIATVWLSGPISQAYLGGPGLPWAFATFIIVLPAITLPLFRLAVYNFAKAQKRGPILERDSRRAAWAAPRQLLPRV